MTHRSHVVGVLFVCLGNICRSPLARVVFEDAVRRRALPRPIRADSCGTGGWHAGEGADPRAVSAAARRGLDLVHVARRVDPRDDFASFQYIIAMDRANKGDLLGLGAPPERVRLARSFDPDLLGRDDRHHDVPDPYHAGDEAFDRVIDMLVPACEGLLDHLAREHMP